MQVLVSYTPVKTEANASPSEQIIDLGELDLKTTSDDIRSILRSRHSELSFLLDWTRDETVS